ncbi:amidohydrolase family protein [uncultured Psychroserpens sp.]|uniref:amidohydrolase family protein n=1 Tax=uncultured Psychroserpens sp. TaxID=255436 RepID=UPI002637B1CF|nr:amidohydrolase family protein [uncultured Psychroserpens sp.]
MKTLKTIITLSLIFNFVNSLNAQNLNLKIIKTEIELSEFKEQEAFKKGQCDRVLEAMEDDISFLANGKKIPSKTIIEKFCKSIPRPFKTPTVSTLDIYPLTNESGYTIKTLEYPLDEGTKIQEYVTKIWRKTKGKWKISHLHSTVKEVPIIKEASQKEIDDFLKNQPIIDVHIHITKGYADNEDYNKMNPDIDLAKLEWMSQRFDKNNIVLALGGGPIKYAKLWQEKDKRHWSGTRLPCNPLAEQDEPCDNELPDIIKLEDMFKNGTFKYLGETAFHSMGIHPADSRFDPYWALAEKYQIPIGFHADKGPFKRNMKETPNWNEAYGNPLLLLPILEKYPNLKIYLMHYPGSYFKECLEVMKKHPRVYCEITAVSMFAPKSIWEPRVKQLFDEGLGNRLMFGSDYVGTIRKNIEIVYNLDWLTEKQKRDIYYNNAATFLGLSESEIELHYNMAKSK